MKEQMMDDQESRRDQEIANELGITLDELNECEWEIDQDISDDGLVYGTYVQFKEPFKMEILRKITGLDTTLNRVQISDN